jgi:hypothetical protein
MAEAAQGSQATPAHVGTSGDESMSDQKTTFELPVQLVYVRSQKDTHSDAPSYWAVFFDRMHGRELNCSVTLDQAKELGRLMDAAQKPYAVQGIISFRPTE